MISMGGCNGEPGNGKKEPTAEESSGKKGQQVPPSHIDACRKNIYEVFLLLLSDIGTGDVATAIFEHQSLSVPGCKSSAPLGNGRVREGRDNTTTGRGRIRDQGYQVALIDHD